MSRTQLNQTTSTRIKAKNIFLYTGIASFAIAAFVVAFLYFNVGVENEAKADVNEYEFTSNSGTYTSFSDGTSLGSDDKVYNNRDLEFNFRYNGINYTKVSISSRGYLIMNNSTTLSSSPLEDINNVISVLGGNLRARSGASLRVKTTGSSPNRIMTVQWEGYKFDGAKDNDESLNFQIKLYETTNVIQFIYGNFKKDDTERFVQVGLRGTSAVDYFNRRTTSNWASTSQGNSTSSNCKLRDYPGFWGFGRDVVYPSSGLTFTFTPPVPVVVNTDLMVNLSVDESDPCLGATLTYTINVANNGPDAASNVEVTSAIPAGLQFISSNVINGTYNSSTGKWVLPSLPNGAVSTLTVVAKIRDNQSGAAITSNAAISSTDNNADNNSSSIIVNVGTNRAPTITDIDNQTTNYNTPTATIDFTIGDVETNASALQVTTASSNPICIPGSNISITGTGTNRKIRVTPGNNQSGTSTISVMVSDGTCTTVRTFVVTVFRQTYTNWQAANIVVGQTSFDAINSTAVSNVIANGSNNTAVSSKGVLAVGSQLARRVLIWNKVPTANGTPADVVVGKGNFTSSNVECSQTRTGNIDGVAFSPDGNKLLVSDASNNRILIYNSIPTASGASADVVIGQTNFTNNSSGCSSTKFSRPTELMVTPDGKLIFVDRDNNRVLIYNKIPTTNGAAADVVIGQDNFTSNSAGTAANRLRLPWNCAFSPEGKLLIADNDNNRVLIFNKIPTTNGASADVVIGQTNFTSRNTGCSATELNYIAGVTVSPAGMVAIADFRNNRVLIYNSVPTENGAAADAVLGQPNFTRNIQFNNGNNQIGNPSSRNMYEPYGINFDLNERLYVNGRGMHRVMIFGETPTEVSDLALTFTSDNGVPCIGTTVNYTIRVRNNGPSEATNVIVTSALPHGFTLQNFTSTSGNYVSASGFWTIPSIPNGASATLTITGTVNEDQGSNAITAYANVRSNNQSDNNFANNGAAVTINVHNNTIPVIDPVADRTVDVGASTGAIAVKIRDGQTTASSLTMTATSSNVALIPNNRITVGGSGDSRTLTITPLADQTGTATITINVSDGTCSASRTFKVNVGNVWLGYTDDWNFARNWSSSIPTSSISVTVPSAPVGGQYPVVYSNTAVARNLTIEEGASLTVNSTRTLTINGNYVNNGSEFTGRGNIIFSSSNAQTVKGKIGSATINNSRGVTMTGDVNSSETITFTSGNLSVGAYTLTIQKAFAGTLTNLSTTSSSSIVVAGSGNGISLPNNISALKDLTLDNPNGASLQRDLQVRGDLTLASGALNLNGRSLTLEKGVITTNGTITGSNTSDLIINGSGNMGSLAFSSTQILRDLTINRTGSGEMTLGSNVTVNRRLTLTNGIIRTGSNLLIVLSTSPDAIVAPDPDATDRKSYIHGNLRRHIASLNEGGTPLAYEFPLGCRNLYQWARIVFTKASNLTYIDSRFTVYSHESQISMPELNFGSAMVNDILNYGYWTFNPSNNNYDVDYDLTVKAQGHSNGANSPDKYTVIKRPNNSSPWELKGVHNNLWNIVDGLKSVISTRKKIHSFCDVSLGISADPLPVQLRDFTGKFDNKAVKLNWTTEVEINNSHFEIERSSDGEYFTKIGEVKGNGNSSITRKYEFVDRNVWEDQYYYRLKQVDFDNNFEHSPIVFVQNKTQVSGLALEIYPNPTNSENINLNISSPDKKSAITVILLNVQGQVFYSTTKEEKAINAMMKLNINGSLTPGAYYIKIQQGSSSATKELIIKD